LKEQKLEHAQTKKEKKKKEKRKKREERTDFKHMIQLISADASVTIIDEVNVESLSTLNANQIKRLTRMVDQRQGTEKAFAAIN